MNIENILLMGPVLESLFKWSKLTSIMALTVVNKEMLTKCSEPLYWEQVIKRYIQLQVDAENLCININPLSSIIENACRSVSKLAEAFIIACVNLVCIDKHPKFFIIGIGNNFKRLFPILVKKWGINLKSNDGLTALQLTYSFNTVEELLKAGADPNVKNKKGNTILSRWSCSRSCVRKADFVELLLKYGADPNVKNKKGNVTPLHLASASGHYEIVELLLKNGADPNESGMHDHTPLIAAGYNQDNRTMLVVELLLKYGADPNKQNNRGETALMYAFNHGRYELVQLLLKAGADSSIQDINGKKAIDVINKNVDKRSFIELLENT